MRYSFLFAIVLIVVSGFIAYFGDLLGRWMGKKRLTLLNLRPRHTAYMVTAATGMLIAALTLTTLIRVNEDFNRLWSEGDRILRQNKTFAKSNKLLAAKNEFLEARRKQLQEQVRVQRKEVDEAQERALKAADAQIKADQAVKRLEKEIAARRKEIESIQRQLLVLKRQSAERGAELKAKSAEFRQLQERMAKARKQLLVVQNGYRLAVDRQEKAQRELSRTNGQLRQAQRAAAEQEKVLRDLEAKVREQQAVLVERGNELIKAQQELMEFERQTSQLLGGSIRFRQGDEIARGTISPRQSTFGIKGDLFSLLDAAGEKAKKQGAGVGPNGRAVVLVFPTRIGQDRVALLENESAGAAAAADLIAGTALQPYDTLVQVLCARNSLAGEQVRVRLVLYYNRLIYRKGDKIAEARMDGRVSEGRALLSLINFLQNEVSRAALGAGLVPVANPDPHASLGADPRTQIEGLMAVVDQIKSKTARVNVQAYASADVHAAQPLNMTNMRFSVSKVE